MALCLTNSLIYWRDFFPYDQMVRYKWWFRHGYMSSTGHCFDIGAATRQSIQEFEKRQRDFAKEHGLALEKMDFYSDGDQFNGFNVNCSQDGVAGNGALMRLAPVPLFFYLDPIKAVQYSAESARITHGDKRAVDACRYYGALIVGALQGMKKDELLSDTFVEKYKHWFGSEHLHDDIMNICKGSYKKDGGYNDGIRGKGYVVYALEAALWAFWSDKDSFKIGVLNAVNLGDDTDTTAAIYGQLAGAFYGFKNLPEWRDQIYAKEFLLCLTKWIEYEAHQWHEQQDNSNQLFNSSPTTSSLGNTSRRRFTSICQRQTNLMGSMTTNVIIRKSNNDSGEIGSLYNAHNDSIISSSNPNRYSNINQSKAVEQCFSLKGDAIEYEKFFEKFHIDNELQLSLFTNLIKPNGFLFFRHYPYLIDEHTRIIFYSKSFKQTHEQMLVINEFQRIDQSATHFIQEIDFGIEILILIRLPSEQFNYFDQYMDNIKDYLLHDQRLNLNHFNNENKQIFVCSNIDSLRKDNKDLINILKEINQIKNQSSLYQPINYYLHPINSQFYPIKQTIKEKLLDILKRFDWIQKYWKTKSTFYEHFIQKYLLEQFEELTKDFDKFKLNFQTNNEQLKTLIIQCRRDKTNCNALENYLSNVLFKIDFDTFIYSLTCFFAKTSFIKHLIQRGFSYENANIYQIKQDQNSQIIETKLLERNPNSLFVCSNDFLNHSSWKIIHELLSSLPSKKIDRSLIYLDFTYSTYCLDEILILPANYRNLKLTNEKSFFDDEHQKHLTSYQRRSSFDHQTINILLLGKSNVGKSTLINNLFNVISSHSYQESKSNGYFLKIPICFQIQDKHGEEHVIQKGEVDFNENYFSSNGSRTQLIKCHSIPLNRNQKKNISLIDTPGFQVNCQERYIQQILVSIIHSKRLNAILFVIESNDNQLDSYRETLKMLHNYFGDNLLENVFFCFTKIFSSDRNFDDLKKKVNEIFSPFNRSVNENSIYQFDSSFLLQSSIYSEKSSLIPKESWQLSKEQLNCLLNTLQENVKPFVIEIPFDDCPLHRVQIKELIRPLLETLRNCLRNEICLERGIKDDFILINAKANENPHAKCCSCKSSWKRIGLFDLILNEGHYFPSECSSCLCQSYEHFRIDYQIIYSHSNSDEQTFDKQNISLKSILQWIKYLSNCLLREEQTDLFLNYFNQIIDEEFTLSHNSFNLSLYMTLQDIKKDYQKAIRQTSFRLGSLIRHVQQIPMIEIQLNAAKRVH